MKYKQQLNTSLPGVSDFQPILHMDELLTIISSLYLMSTKKKENIKNHCHETEILIIIEKGCILRT